MLQNTPIALGFTAEIYAWKDGQVLKLFNQGISRGTVEYEANLTRIAHEAGLPVPEVGEIVEVDDRFGLEYERLDGMSMLEMLLQKPWMYRRLAHQLAEMQVEVHKHQVPDMPSQRERLERKIRSAQPLSENLRQTALQSLKMLPEEHQLCHGDFHPGNILMTPRGAVIIDWIDATHGYPLVDVARSTLLFGGGPLPPGIPKAGLVVVLRRWFHQAYLKRYFELSLLDQKQLATWLAVAAAARLEENILGDEQRLLSIAQNLVRME
jgi:uncharacterized protein (TIGR02172 family)